MHKDWNSIDWVNITYKVTNIQTIIYEASKFGNTTKVHVYQNAIINMEEAKLLSVRKVTQDNIGKRTAGVDGIKKLNGKQRLELIKKIKIDGKASAIRRIWIPKPGKKEKRPLGIPTIKDRVKQHLVKLAIEPQWEALFENDSYGFRPGRSSMDAITRARTSLGNMEKHVLDADIRKCFDRIDHEVLIKKINTSPTITRHIDTWLKAGIMDPEISTDPVTNDKGTPQGGQVSPVLANIALHGIYDLIQSKYTEINTFINKKKYQRNYLTFIRYADDFIVIHPHYEVILKIKEVISEFLKEIGLELNEEKTKIRNNLNSITYNNESIKPGFTYLGVYFRLYKSKSSDHKNPGSRMKSGLKSKCVPSNDNVLKHLDRLRILLKQSRGQSQIAVIRRLAPIINGWTFYYRYSHSSRVFNYCDSKLFWTLGNGCLDRHRNMGKIATLNKYFLNHRGRQWTFGTYLQGVYPCVLPFHVHRKIEYYNKIKADYSPFSNESIDMAKNLKLNKTATNLFKRQNGSCKWCLYPMRPGDLTEIHHKLPKGNPKREYQVNKWLIHRHCHDALHAYNVFDFDQMDDVDHSMIEKFASKF